MARKIELLNDQQEVVHPLTSPDCVIMENGKTLDEVMGDGIATPTLTHEGTSFKVGVGDSNIEVVDGDVAGMTLKGQSYQNILPKPTTLIMETEEQEFKINDKIDSNIIIDDNIAEIATVKGKTIVNTVQEESASEYTVLGEDLSGQSIAHVKETSALEGQTLVNLWNNNGQHSITPNSGIEQVRDCFKKSTKYLLKYNVLQTNTNNALMVQYYHNGTWVVNELSYMKLNQDYYILTTPSGDFNEIRIFYNASFGVETVKLENIMLLEYQEGMENWHIPYFEGTKYFESNIKGVTLQGQTLVNTIQEPCKDDYVVLGAEDGIEISAETSGYGTIEDTVQGGLNGVVLEGQTLVNLIRGGREFTIQGGTNKGFALAYSQTTAYTLLFKVNKNNSSNKLLMQEYNGESWLRNVQIDLVSGENKAVITPTNNVTQIVFVNSATDELVIGDMMLLNGNHNNHEIPYFEGMSSVKMPVLTTTGKNLFDIDKVTLKNAESHFTTSRENNGIKVTVLTYGAWREFAVGHFMKVKPNATYITSFEHSGVMQNMADIDCCLIEFDANYKEIKRWYSENVFEPITVENETHYLRLDFRFRATTPVGEGLISNIQLEEGSTATSYEPYQSSTVTTEKNLFDGILTPDYLADATGQPSGKGDDSSAHCCHTPSFIPIQANEKFRLRATSDGITTVGDGRVYFYDKDYNYLNVYVTSLPVYVNIYSMDVINTVPNNSNIAYMRVRFFNGSGVQADSVQINKVYELRGIGNVKDELDLQTGKLTQRIGEVVLDGSEDWKINASYTNEYRINFVLNRGEIPSNCKFICNQYVTTTLRQEDTLTDYMYVGNLNINVFTEPNITLDEFKLQLQSNPLILQYPLATPIVKTIDLQVTNQDGKTIPHIQTQPTVTHITASSDYLIPTVTIDNNLAYDTIIKPSTLYTVRFKHDTVNADNPLTVDLGGTTQTVTSTEFTITTPDTLTHNQLVFSGKNNVVSEVQVIEGDVTNIEYPFFEGMNDVKFSDSKFIARNCPFVFGKGGRI